ncbi:alpha/beta hydrolase [Nocardia sp. CA2R105]|uniref:alpha/beta hydrolase n=1 Tax=Nocardia coffeae TaxID=2873381 RepID=UPI001CA63D8D|nr:alpha/beta hydrolase [Nocardia coffeae]MBY8858507.1 alpha/beta hydrolase [Nocardia coffeae]
MITTASRRPIVLDGFAIDDHWLPFLLHDLLDNFRLDESLAQVIREIADAAAGSPTTTHGSELRSLVQALRDGEDSALAEIACGDTAAPEDPAWYWNNIQATRTAQPVFGAFANNIEPCAYWPRPAEPATVVRNDVPALIIQATDDPRTPYQNGVHLHRAMPATRLVTLQNVRIHMTFRPQLSRCVDDAINTYLDTGTRPSADLTCRADTTAP